MRHYQYHDCGSGGGGIHVRPYSSMEAVAAVGSKYFMRVVGEVKSLGSAAIFPFLDDLPAELVEVLRCRDTGG